jgi:hypothetical protein
VLEVRGVELQSRALHILLGPTPAAQDAIERWRQARQKATEAAEAARKKAEGAAIWLRKRMPWSKPDEEPGGEE